MELLEQLKGIGLSDKESAAYMALLKHGNSQTSLLAKKSGLNRGTAYLALHSLLAKGLVSKNVKKNVQTFTALNPENIRYFLENQRKELDVQIESSGELISHLSEIVSPLSRKPKIQIFEGQEGARAALMETLSSKEDYLRAFLSIYDLAEFVGEEFFEYLTNERIARGPDLRTIRSRETDEMALSVNRYAHKYLTDSDFRREVRYLEGKTPFPITIYMFDETVVAISTIDEGFALIIRSKDLTTMLKGIFDTLWVNCELAIAPEDR